MVTDFRGPAETLDFTDLVMISFPKAKRFTDGVSYLYFMKNTGNITSTQNIEFNVKS